MINVAVTSVSFRLSTRWSRSALLIVSAGPLLSSGRSQLHEDCETDGISTNLHSGTLSITTDDCALVHFL